MQLLLERFSHEQRQAQSADDHSLAVRSETDKHFFNYAW